MSPSVLESLQSVKTKIFEAEKRSGRSPNSVTIVAASKFKSAQHVVQASQNGVHHFGENYVQEGIKKIKILRELHTELNIQWHFIGALQTNKTKLVVGQFDTIQSVDRVELAVALNTRAAEAGITQKIFLQIKIGDEPTKAGVSIEDTPLLIEKVMSLSHLRLEGLMSLPPIEAEAEGSRKYFSELRECREKWRGLVSAEKGSLQHLSMGTTHDFEVAIEEGATMVRVGTAIFGERSPAKADH